MTLIYILAGIAIVHVLFLLNPSYRDEALDVYIWTPWTEKDYALFKKVTGNSRAVKIRLFVNFIVWPFLVLFILVMPVVFLFRLPGKSRANDAEINYSKDGKKLLKVAKDCTRVKVKEGVEVIAKEAFDSTKVTHIILPDTVKVLEPNALLRAHYLESINLPDSITKIDVCAFQFCGEFGNGLKIELPKHLHYLGGSAFYGCSKLEELTIRGDFVWEQSWLSGNPFYYTKSLAVIKSTNPNFIVEDGMLMSADGKILFRCVNEKKRVVVKGGVETIAQGAFCGRDRMEEIVLPNSLRTICRYAFSGCQSIDNVVLPEGVVSIGVESFSHCSSLKSMTLPASLKSIELSAFENSSHLQNFVYPKDREEEFKKMIEDGRCDLPF